MRPILFGRYGGPLVALGGLVAISCLTSTWYINRLQSDLARAVRHDVVRMEAADELQLRLRQLRFHAMMFAADPSASRRRIVDGDRVMVRNALEEVHRECDSPGDLQALESVARGYQEYEAGLNLDVLTTRARVGEDLIVWSDAHQVQGLLDRCREFEDRQRDRMDASLEQSETQTRWAGRVLFGLGFVGALGGLLSGYATARRLTRRATQLSVRVQAVQAQLDQEVGAMTVVGSQSLDDLDEQLDRVIGRVKDVCQRLQEQERDLLRAEQLGAVGHLAAGVAHEIRNPLTGIKFLIEGALRTNNSTPLAEHDLRLMHQEVVRIGRTVQGLLDFARSPRYERHPHDLGALLNEAVGIVGKRADAKSVRLSVTTDSGLLRAEVDRDQFLSLVTNLLLNAIEATPPGGEVQVDGTACADSKLKLTICDSGPGIDPVIMQRLFTPFATTKPTGTGLGLTVAQRIACDHGGTLTAENRPGGGARFTLLLPDSTRKERSNVETPGR